MAIFISLTSVLIFTFIILMFLYAYYIVKLRWHLEKNHEVELEKLNLGRKISRLIYYSTPSQAKNVMKFIFSDHNLGDPKIKYLKTKLRIVICLAILWCIFYILSLLFLTDKM